ncbi:hypothetical protein Tco_0720224, partial [Tanacetum coccineum]
EILKKFNYTDVKSTSTLVDLEKPLVKDGDADDVDCKKQTVVATSTTEAEYVASASCCGQVLWIQNQLLDYGYNFMNTVINIDINKEPTKLVEDLSSGKKGKKEVTTANVELNTASASISTVSPSKVSTAEDISGAKTLVYIRRSGSKDKRKAIMTESEPKQPTTKLKLRQESAGLEAAIRLQEQLNEEES